MVSEEPEDVISGVREGRVVVRVPVLRMSLMALGSLAFVVAGVAILSGSILGLGEAISGGGLFVVVISVLPAAIMGIFGAAAAGFFGMSLVYCSVRILSGIFGDGVMLEIGPDGIVDRASAVGVGFVSWDEISRTRFASVSGQRFVVMEVRDPERLLEKMNPVRRAVVRVNRRYFTGGEISIPLGQIGMSEKEMRGHIRSARERLRNLRRRSPGP